MHQYEFQREIHSMPDVIVWGASGQAKVLNECLFGTDIRIVATFDNGRVTPPLPGIPIFIGEEGFHVWRKSYRSSDKLYFLVAVGGHDRLKLHDWLVEEGFLPLTVIHRAAYVAVNATVGAGCQILAHATVCAEARLERSVIINTAASVDHECQIGAGAHIGPGVRLAGAVSVGEQVFIGTGAVILPKLRIGANATVAAGAVVVRDVPAGATVMGTPARIQRSLSTRHSRHRK
jgi:sugar O-acyltransferase (sialic acid O-acetyltransferase NeuD family)